MPVQCVHCRGWNRDSATYCDVCGRPLGAAPPQKTEPTAPLAVPPHAVLRGRKSVHLKKVRGEVRNLQERQESGAGDRSTNVRTFVVESYDAAGNRLPPVPVEMRGRGFQGVLSPGDTVEIAKKWREGQTLRVKKLRNVTTGGSVSVRRIDWLLLFIILFIIVVVVLIASAGR